jgi:DNA-binding response OmpR family regulator
LRRSFAVDVAYTGEAGESLANENRYDVVVLDFNLPDRDGVEVCRNLRSGGIFAPVLMLTGRHKLHDKVSALDAGADDYLTKPFEIAELQARLRALLRRPTNLNSTHSILHVADLSLDLRRRIVMRGGQKIVLRRKEFQILELLIRNLGHAVSRAEFLEHVWDASRPPSENALESQIKNLRAKLARPVASVKPIIKTIFGEGYTIDV